MRRTLARTRDTLDAKSLPPTENMELNYRTRITTDAEDLITAIRILSLETVLIVTAIVLVRLLAAFSLFWTFCLLTVCVLVTLSYAGHRFLRDQPAGESLYWAFGFFAAAIAALLTGFVKTPLAAYLFLFLPAVGFTAWLSHQIATQFVYFMSVSVRLKWETTERWQGYWEGHKNLRTPEAVPELETYRLSFLLLAAALVVGLVSMAVAAKVTRAPSAGLIGFLSFFFALPATWILLNRSSAVSTMSFFKVTRVTWKGLVTFLCYNRHETRAPGVFHFPLRFFRSPLNRYLAVACSITLFAVALVPLGSPVFGARLGELWSSIWPPKAAQEPAPFVLRPHEKIYMEELPLGERRAYLDQVRARREESSTPVPSQSRHEFKLSLSLLLVPALWLLGPFSTLFSIFWFTAGRVLTVYYDALEAEDAFEASTDTGPWDNRIDRIQNSRNALEREHLYLGSSLHHDYPILLHRDLIHRHAHILGDTGSRKTSLGLAPLLAQLIASEDSSVLVLDLKGDMALFECARLEAEAAGLPFKWFTNVTGRSSYLFNPLEQSHLPLLTPNQRTQGILQALSLEYGEQYGRAYFSALHEIVLLNYLRHYGQYIHSFKDLRRYVVDPMAYERVGHVDDWEKARHLAMVVDKLSSVYSLNLTSNDVPDQPALIAEQIDIPSLLRDKQVVYFFLPAAQEPTTVSPIAKLALFALLASASRRSPDQPHRVHVFIDEFQRILSENIQLLLEQSRSMQLSLILSNQTFAQLQRAQMDITDTVDSCTAFRQTFRASDLKSMERLEKASGEALYHTLSWHQDVYSMLDDSRDDAFSMRSGVGGFFDVNVCVAEKEGPRLEKNTIIELSAAPLASVVRFTEGSGYTQFSGYHTPIVSEYHISSERYRRREKANWPGADEKTVIVRVDADIGPREADPVLPGRAPEGTAELPSPSDTTEHALLDRLRRAGEALNREMENRNT
jgi:hypothetical protein